MSLDARIRRLAPTLTAKERALMVLRSLKAETEEDPVWRRTMPYEQVREFNRLIGAMNVANIEVVALVSSYAASLGELEARVGWWVEAAALQKELAESGKQTAAAKWDERLEMLTNRISELALRCWQGLRAVEVVWDEMSREFGDEDIARGIWRDLVAETKHRVTQVARAMEPIEDEEALPEPDEGQLEKLRAYVTRMRNAR